MSKAATPLETASVSPLLPLTLLQALRAHDQPTEVLEDENFTESLPRRFGLSEVVFLQIRRYEDALRRGRDVPLSEVGDLLRLVLRRPDAAAVLRQAGFAIARRQYQRARRPAAVSVAGHGLPKSLVFIAVRRTAGRLIARLLGPGRLRMVGRPLVARIRHPFTAESGGDQTACILFSAIFEELVHLYTRARPNVVHYRCESRGDAVCEWGLAG